MKESQAEQNPPAASDRQTQVREAVRQTIRDWTATKYRFATDSSMDLERAVLAALAPFLSQPSERPEIAISWDSADPQTCVLVTRYNGRTGHTVIYRGQSKDGFWREKMEQPSAPPTPAGEDTALLKFIRENCKVLYWPDGGGYPIEHSLAARKNMWAHLMEAQEAAMQSRPSPTLPEGVKS